MYHIIDIFFVIFHSALVIFNLFGWIWKKTRFLNLITLLLTGSSWLLLGLITGIMGYCPLTDWHFRILEKLGVTDLPTSYMKYLADRITGLDFNSGLVDKITLISFLAALSVSFYLNIRNYLKSKKSKA